MINEHTIRDSLAQHLDLVESGLTLIKKEYTLPAYAGAGGSIDILARDSLGLLVVIELKRSDQSARAALHELFKYVELLRVHEGVGLHQIRCVLVSTTWHELLVPFSSFASTVSYPVLGLHAKVDSRGEVLSAERVLLVKPGAALALCPFHMSLLYQTSDERDSQTEVAKVFQRHGVTDFAFVDLDYVGANKNVIYPHSRYVVLSAIHASQQPVALAALEIADEENNGLEEWDLEQEVCGKVAVACGISPTATVEGGTSEVFVAMRENWRIAAINRYGRFASSALLASDQQMVELISSFQGGNEIAFMSVGRPTQTLAWAALIEGLRQTLTGNPIWETGTLLYLQRIVDTDPEANVSIHIFNPTNTVIMLARLFAGNAPRAIPALEVVCRGLNRESVVVLVGGIEWDGVTRPDDPLKVAAELFGELFPFSMMHSGQRSLDATLMLRHGLRYHLFEMTLIANNEPSVRELVVAGGALVPCESNPANPMRTLGDFLEANRDYGARLRELLNTFTSGLDLERD